MSGFASIFSLGRSVLATHHEQALSFQPPDDGAADETVRAIVGAIDIDLHQGDDTQVKMQKRTIEVPMDTSEQGPSTRARGGKFTIAGEVWTVELEQWVDMRTRKAGLMLVRDLRLESGGRSERIARR